MTTALPDRVDVAIAGAGTSGAAAAAACARAGLRVLCVDRGPLDRAGARWLNGVPAWQFREAGFDLPAGEELAGGPGPFHLIAGWGPRRVIVDDHDVLEVDMRHLVARLQETARAAGAVLVGGVSVRGLEGGRLVTDRGAVQTAWVVDAAGLAGPRLLDQPAIAARDLCVAAAYVHQLRDRAAAEAFFAEHQVPAGQVLCFAGIAGGYSVLNLRLKGDRIHFLTGTVPADGQPAGKQLIDDFIAGHSWVGERIFGGARALPLRRSHDRLAAGQVALLGDSGCQVFPAHGSGIGSGMIAARLLADTLASGGTVGDYGVRWQRTWGGLHASYDLFRRFTQTLSVANIEQLIDSGLLDPARARFGLAQRLPRLTAAEVPAVAAAATRAPRLARRLGAVAARMLAMRALYARYPEDPDRVPAWARRVARVAGEALA